MTMPSTLATTKCFARYRAANQNERLYAGRSAAWWNRELLRLAATVAFCGSVIWLVTR